MAKYTMADFIAGKIAVHTGLDSQKFLELCGNRGLKWAHGDKATDWKPETYGADTCIVYSDKRLMHGPRFLFRLLVKHIVVKPEDIAEMNPPKPSLHRIIIECNDDKITKAYMQVGSERVKTTIARCNPVDKFDFAIGAKVAFDRLFGKEPDAPSAPAPAPKFKVGDRVKCIRAVDNKTTIIGKYGTVKSERNDRYAVEFDTDIAGHSCVGLVKGTRGWYCPVDALELVPYREVKRPAKVGEYVKIVKSTFIGNRFKVGEIHKVISYFNPGMGFVLFKCGGPHATPTEYVVLEGYKPE